MSASSSAANSFHSTPLVPSLSTPSLSALFAKRGLGGDLQSATEKAKEKLDLGGPDEGDGEEEDISAKASPVARPTNGNSRTVGGTGPKIASDDQQSVKGHRQPLQRPRPAPLAATRSTNPEALQDTELSPHTADSNPGLVSDHEDDPASEADEETRSVMSSSQPIGLARGCSDAMDVDLDVNDDHDEHGMLMRQRSIRERNEMHGSGSPSSRPRSRYDDGEK